MVDLSHKSIVSPSLWEIVENREVLIEDSLPVLYTGKNVLGDRLVGAAVIDDDDLRVTRHLVVRCDSGMYSRFMTQAISFRQMMEESPTIFAVDQDYSDIHKQGCLISIADIPPDELPRPNSFMYQALPDSSYEFSVKLEGMDADQNEIRPSVLAKMGPAIADTLSAPYEILEQAGSVDARILPFRQGSFEILVRVRPAIQPQLFEAGNYSDFASEVLRYCMNAIHEEAALVFGKNQDGMAPERFNRLAGLYGEISNRPVDQVVDKLRDAVQNITEKLAKTSGLVGDGFRSAVISNHGATDLQIGVLDSISSPRFIETSELIEGAVSIVRFDPDPTNYEVLVYSLNVESHKCSAHVRLDESMPKVKIVMPPEFQVAQSPLSESLHMEKLVTIQAVGKWVDDKLRTLTIPEVQS